MTAPIQEIFATEEVLLDSLIAEIERGEQPKPIFMIYRSRPHSISIAGEQSMAEIDIEKCKEIGADYIRRKSGGRAVYHNHLTDFSYSIIAPAAPFLKTDDHNTGGATVNTTKAYREMLGVVVNALRKIGIPAEIEMIDDPTVGRRNTNIINVDGKKISASAQLWRFPKNKPKDMGAFMQHGYILYKKPSLYTGYQLIKAKRDYMERAKEALEMSTSIAEYVDVPFGTVVNSFLDVIECEKMVIERYQKKLIEQLIDEHYNSDSEWQINGNGVHKTKGDCIRCDHRGIAAVIE